MNARKENIRLKKLQKGDLVRILCTARSVQKVDLQLAVEFLEEMGLRVDYGDTIGKIHHQFGGTAQERLADFKNAWNDPEVDVIWIARGGYGTIQILDELDFASEMCSTEPVEVLSKLAYVKPIIGYSDVTLIHNKMQKAGLPSIHAFMPLEFETRYAQAKASFQKTLFGEEIVLKVKNTDNLPEIDLTGTLYGGNLSILYSMLGSEDLPDFENGILFIEDIDEYLYHIERMMLSLKRAGKLKNLTALVVGGMTDMNDHEIPFGKSANEIILDVTGKYNYPVIFNFPAGHQKDHRTLKLGCEMKISISKDTITFTQ